MSYIMVDIEADGPIPGDYSMVSFAAIVVDEHLNKSFYAELKPISKNYLPKALAISGHSREETLKFYVRQNILITIWMMLKEMLKHY